MIIMQLLKFFKNFVIRRLFGPSIVIYSDGGFSTGKLSGKPEQIGDFSVIIYGGDVIIGKNVKIGYGVKIISASTISSNNQVNKKKIKIGNNVQIGSNAVILPGIEIGDNSIIGAGAVVTKNVPPNSNAFGVPAEIFFRKKTT